jgi:hypothetical protein
MVVRKKQHCNHLKRCVAYCSTDRTLCSRAHKRTG